MQATPGSTSGINTEDAKESEEKSDVYSTNMTEAMGAGQQLCNPNLRKNNLSLMICC